MQPHLLLTYTVQAVQKAQHSQPGAGPLKPIRGVFAVTKEHNEIRQEWGDGEDPAALCYRHKILSTTHNKSKVWMGGRACFESRAQDIFFICRIPVQFAAALIMVIHRQ